MAQDKIYNAGDVDVSDVTIITSTGFAQTITPQVIGIEIYEDIFSSFITGKIFVKDSQELINLLPLVGEEVVRISFVTPSLEEKDSYSGEFYIYKMEDRVQAQQRELLYTLHFISKEAIIDMNTKISKCYSGKISSVVNKILVDDDSLYTKKSVNIEETKNSIKYVSNFWAPTINLQYLCDSAVNDSDSPSYIFFENKHGLNFISLETMYSAAPFVQRFVWDNYSADIQKTGGSRRDIDKDYQRIIEISTPNTYNYIDRLKSGLYGSEIIYYNILTKQYVHKTYEPSFTDTKHLNEYPPWSSKIAAKPRAMIIHGHTYYNNFDGYDDVTNSKIIQKRKSLIAQAESYKVTISVFGRTDYSVGQRVIMEVPKNTHLPASDPEYLDRIMSGNYLISAICHFVNRQSHTCSIELIKDSYLVNLNDPK